MSKDYDETIAAHYRQVAEKDGLSPASTMADEVTRATETHAIEQFVEAGLGAIAGPAAESVSVADIGCGNGYTLGRLSRKFSGLRLTGLELSDDLRALAEKRVREERLANVTIRRADIRDADFAGADSFAIAYAQRVLINLLSETDQKRALDNIVAAIKPGGLVLFIEAFSSALENLNDAREEFDLDRIPAAHHNLYLEDDLFDHPQLVAFEDPAWTIPANFLSTHYYVSRVLVPVLRRPKEFKRNSHLARFLSEALPPAIGDYSQLRILAFRKIETD